MKTSTRVRHRLCLHMLFLFSAILLTHNVRAQDWVQTGNVGFSEAEIRYPCMAVDKNGVPYMAYQDYNSREAVVKKFNGSDWVNVGSPGFSEGEATGLSLVIDKNGTPYLSYTSGGEGEDAYLVFVKKFNGSQWVTVGQSYEIGQGTELTSLAIKKDGTIFVAFQDGYGYGAARVKKFNGTNWVSVGGQISSSTADGISLAINEKDGLPYIAYADRYNSYTASVKKFNGSSWVSVGSPSLTPYRVGYTCLSIDKEGVPYLAYINWINYNIYVGKYIDGSWQAVGIPYFSEGDVTSLSLALDANGLPYVAYRDWSVDEGKATVSRFTGKKWANVGSAGFTPTAVENVSLALDTISGTAYMAYQDNENDNYANVMSFEISALPVNFSDFNVKQAGTTAILTWATLSEYNNDRFEVQRSSDGVHFKTIGAVAGKINSSLRVDYSFIDHNPEDCAVNYYRIKQIDRDGRAVISRVHILQLRSTLVKVNIFPNPASEHLRINFAGKHQKITLEIYDLQGSVVLRNNYVNPYNQVEVDIHQLPAGSYQLVCKDEKGKSYSGMFLKQ